MNIIKKLVSICLMGTLLFSGVIQAVAIDSNFKVENTKLQTSDTFSYKINNDGTGITITDLPEDYTGSLTIPNTINSLPVTSIGWRAFYNCENLTSIIIPNSVINIGESAFEYCINLTTITIPNSVTNIGDCAFKYCTSLKSILFPASLTSIKGCAFSGCTGLTSINVSDNNKNYSSENGILYNKIKTEIINYPAGKLDETFTIPDSITTIGDYAFSNQINLTSIIIPNSVTTIDWCAFENCSNLKNITIPDSLTIIDCAMFSGCRSLTTIAIPDSIKYIGESAFENCSSLKSVTIGNCVTCIGGFAFCGCRNLTTITIPNSVTNIVEGAFYNCKNITSVTIPYSVKSIGLRAFYNCNNLTIYGSKGSFAQSYAKENSIPFKTIASEYAMKLESTKAYNNGVLEDTQESVINGVTYKAKLQFNNFKTFLPTRSVAQSLSLEVGYDASTGASTVTNGTKTVKIIPNSSNIIFVENGVTTTVNTGVAPIYVSGVIHVPVKDVIEQFGFFVNWQADGYLLITDYEVASNEIDTLKAKVATLL